MLAGIETSSPSKLRSQAIYLFVWENLSSVINRNNKLMSFLPDYQILKSFCLPSFHSVS